jgi:ABC-2 type transport system permease protein
MNAFAARARLWLGRLRVMITKEFLQLGRDLVILGFTVYAFTVDVYLAGSGVSLTLRNAATVVYDADRSYASRELLSRFQLPYFDIEEYLDRSTDTVSRLDAGEAMIALEIPPQFEADLLRGTPTSVLMQVDTTNTVLGLLASSYAAQIVGTFGLEASMSRAGLGPSALAEAPMIVDDHRVWFNPNQNDTWFMSISELLLLITVFAMILPAAALLREKERGTIEQLLVSPLSPLQIMFSKMLSMTTVILALTALSLFFVLRAVFEVPARGNLWLFFGVTALYVLSICSLGLLIATFARNLAQGGMLIVLFLAPMIFLSGAWTPPEAMPGVVRTLMLASPLHYYIDASYGILLRGASASMLRTELLGIVLLGSLSFALALIRFRRQF